ncbi:unnamed protein product, partial [Durusdinium trenchii]
STEVAKPGPWPVGHGGHGGNLRPGQFGHGGGVGLGRPLDADDVPHVPPTRPPASRPQGLPDGGEPFGESGTLSGREVLPARGQIWKKDEKGCCPPHWRNIPALSRIVGKTWSSCGQSQLQRAPACAQERPQGSLPLAKPCFSGCVQHWK